MLAPRMDVGSDLTRLVEQPSIVAKKNRLMGF